MSPHQGQGLYESVREAARSRLSSTAIVTSSGASVDYSGLMELADRLACGLLREGVGPGDTVACAMPNSIDYVAFILAVARLRAVYVPIMEHFDAERTRLVLEQVAPRLSLVDGDRALPADAAPVIRLADLRDIAPRAEAAEPAGDPGWFRMMWTSGSTGVPKRMVWRQDRFVAERRRWIADTGLTETDVFYCRHTLDVAHATDLHVFAALLSGARLVLGDPAAPADEHLRQLEHHRVTVMSALPHHYEELVEAAGRTTPVDLSRLRRPLCGGAYLGSDVVRAADRVLGIRVRQIYGSTEFGLGMGDMSDRVQDDLLMVPVRGVGVRIAPLDPASPRVGELVLRSECTSEGYVDNDEANARTFRDGEFWTGDIAREVADGRYRSLGRVAEALSSSEGPLPAPLIDERVRERFPDSEAVALPVRPGENGRDVLVVISPASARRSDEMRSYVEELCGAWDLAVKVRFRHGIPRTEVGKVDKPLLRREYGCR